MQYASSANHQDLIDKLEDKLEEKKVEIESMQEVIENLE